MMKDILLGVLICFILAALPFTAIIVVGMTTGLTWLAILTGVLVFFPPLIWLTYVTRPVL